ncbi:salicylate hydroxylase [Apiospora kogelbergensis]|uniref:salicylate hydroxylase n=1 Tax=Apiospora kogelbergensis TaxID=1337665 RepID=UPI0031327E6A
MPLHIVVVGAGIAGLTAATALRQAGHRIVILEKYAVSNVAGAAINVTPNGGRVLARLGFDLARARVCPQRYAYILNGADLRQLNSTPMGDNFAVHRADLNEELLRLATMNAPECQADPASSSSLSWGPPVEIRVGCEVRCVSEDGMGVVLESGEQVRGDLVVGADGVHSVTKKYVAGEEAGRAGFSGIAAFRFLIESATIRADEYLASWMETSMDAVHILADPAETVKERHMVWYTCHGGELLNFVGFHPSSSTTIEDDTEELKAAMMAEFSHFDPKVQKIIALSNHIKRWPLFHHIPLSSWVRGRVVLIGDAAHPMLPFGGQGAAQGMEDGAALGVLLKSQSEDGVETESALSLFQTIRRNRVARIQILSSVRAGRESKVANKMGPYLDETVPKAPTSLHERFVHDSKYDTLVAPRLSLSAESLILCPSYDVYADCERSLE